MVRGIYEWCTDNGFTPYIAVVVDERTEVPREFARDGQIVLNISADATSRLAMDNDYISFVARFGGVARNISFPVGNVVAIYAKENGAGMAFEVEDTPLPDASPEPEPPAPPAGGRPKLQRVK